MDSLYESSARSPGLKIELLESSFKLIAPEAEKFVAAFYERLFQSFPETRQFFTKTDMAEQRKKLVSALVLVIENLRNPEALTGALTSLGRKHQSYGITEAYYPMVGDALLKTMSAFLAERWTVEIEQTWTEAYGVVARAMLNGYTAPDAP